MTEKEDLAWLSFTDVSELQDALMGLTNCGHPHNFVVEQDHERPRIGELSALALECLQFAEVGPRCSHGYFSGEHHFESGHCHTLETHWRNADGTLKDLEPRIPNNVFIEQYYGNWKDVEND